MHYIKKCSQTLTVSQALLLLIEKYQTDPHYLTVLKKLYFIGPHQIVDFLSIHLALKDDILAPYQITKQPINISEDPSRRYFETHYAYALLKENIKAVSLKALKKHYQFLYSTVADFYHMSNEDFYKKIEHTFSSMDENFVSDPTDCEYHDALRKIDLNEAYTDFSDEEKLKMTLMFKISYLCVVTGTRKIEPPMNIYTEDFFNPNNRGQDIKDMDQQKTVKSQYFGLMKSYMPVPRDDLAFAKKPFRNSRPADKMNFKLNAAWVKNNFNRWVHPFSCSLSGTLLMNLRWMLYAKQLNQLFFNNFEDIKAFLAAYIPLMIFNSGGHSFYEFTYPLHIRTVQKNFSFIDNFNALTMENLFLKHHKDAFKEALDKTLLYQRCILNHHQVTQHIKYGLFAHPHQSNHRPKQYDCSIIKILPPNHEPLSESTRPLQSSK